jgi:allantoinase
MRLRSLSVQQWAVMVERAAERLRLEGVDSGRLLLLALHPYVVGQPFRIRALERVLERLASADGVRFATADDVCEWYVEAGRLT